MLMVGIFWLIHFSFFQMLWTEDLDISGLSLHQAKRLEMESQVRVLELEASLDQERLRLAALRRHHYQLAGDVEGWDQEVTN